MLKFHGTGTQFIEQWDGYSGSYIEPIKDNISGIETC